MLASSLFGGSSVSSKSGAPVEEEVAVLGGAASRRRLRHVSQIAVRGLDFEAATSEGFYLELHPDGSEEVLEHSDLFRTRNPTWAPACGIRCGRHLSSCELRAVQAVDKQTCWRYTIHLAGLEPLGEKEDLGMLNEPPPLGVPLLKLFDKEWFALPVNRTIPPPASPHRSNSSAKIKKIKASEICAAGEEISTQLIRLKSLQAQSTALRQSMEEAISKGRDLHEQWERHASHELRVSKLRQEFARRRDSLDELRKRLEAARASHASQASRLSEHRESLASTEEERRASASSLPTMYSDLRSLSMQLRCRQIRMLHEVRQVYPITSHEDSRVHQWKISGLRVEKFDTLNRMDQREEENTSTALGFLAHLIVTLASILEVPLRVRVHSAGCSRSFLTDPHDSLDSNAAPREYPLHYFKEKDKPRFRNALKLLRDCLREFLYSRGYVNEKRTQGGDESFLECAELIIEKEMRGIS